MLNRCFKAIALAVVCLLGGNALIWPRFYYSNLPDPLQLPRVAWTTAPFRNLAALIFLFLVLLSYQHLSSNKSKIIEHVNWFLDSSLYIILVWLVVGLAAIRLFIFSITYAPPVVAEAQEEERKFRPITTLVDSVFLDKAKINSAYSQLQGSFKPQEKTVRTALATETTADATAGPLTAGKRTQESGETEVRFVAEDAVELKKSIELINYLGKKEDLLTIAEIGTESEELSNFDSASALLKEQYEISLPHDEILSARDGIILGSLATMNFERFRAGKWILVEGSIAVTLLGNRSVFIFDYLPSAPGRLEFRCQVPSSSIPESDGIRFQTGSKWELYLFGKIAQVSDSGESFRSEMICYSIFR